MLYDGYVQQWIGELDINDFVGDIDLMVIVIDMFLVFVCLLLVLCKML